VRFLHTSDIHLGKLLHGVSLLDNQRHALDQVIDILQQREVDGLIIAGDLYDKQVPPVEAVNLLNQFLLRVCEELRIPCYIIAGNHDSGDRLGFAASLLEAKGLYLAGPVTGAIPPLTVKKGDEAVDIFLIPYAHPRVVAHRLGIEAPTHQVAMEALVERAQAGKTAGRPSIVVAHCFVTGSVTSESEMALSVGGSEEVSAALFREFDYAALGHLHAPQHREVPTIRYSGSLLKYSFSEISHNKGVSLIDIEPDGAVEIEHIELQVLQDVREIRGPFAEIMEAGRTDPKAGDFVRICLTDDHTIPGVMSQLQTVYPNALELEDVARREIDSSAAVEVTAVEQLAPLDAFKEFYEAVHEKPMDELAVSLMQDVIETVETGMEAQS
jgi:DNA repair protein SbcD/Mre11